MNGLPFGSATSVAYAELHCRSNFSFLEAASHPKELVARAAQLGYRALAITDECSMAGIVRAHEEAKHAQAAGLPLHLIIGSEFTLQPDGDVPGCRIVLLACNRNGYGNLCELITLGRMRRPKGQYHLTVADVATGSLAGMPDCLALLIPRRDDPPATLLAQAHWLAETFGEHAAIAIELLYWADDSLLVERLPVISAVTGVPLVAAGDVRMHVRSRKPLLDTLTAIRLNTPLADCGHALPRNAEQHLRPLLALGTLYRREWLAHSVRLAEQCTFSLDELRYEYPAEIVPTGHTAQSYLREQTWLGAAERYPQGVPQTVAEQIEKELALIAEMQYEAFFLTVHDIVRFARSQAILCQGRGSAANSVVCYCLRITEVNPVHSSPLFERFISRERNEPPDIDVDFEHERREEVIQYIYRKYGRDRTALAAALATYRVRGAVRDVGKALGIDALQIDAVAKAYQWFDASHTVEQRLVEQGLDPEAPVTKHWLELTRTLWGFPRHLSQHTGGFVISKDKLSRLVPIEPAAMENRCVIQWDKDDLESLKLLKVDVLALGMLTVLRRTLDLLSGWTGRRWQLQDIPQGEREGEGDPATYAMIQQANTVGVFQIESRAQQSMLPRLKPDKFYDLVIEVAIVRPGPIQGGSVHPYLKRKQGKEPATMPYPALEPALKRTLGVPIFQEQVMQICMIAANFTPGEADELRRAMAAWRREGRVDEFKDRVVEGMVRNHYDRTFAENIFKQIEGFGEYGFPESHAYSFALLAYLSAWLKCHQPAAFLAALLNSQPMGFYAPAQLVQDARRNGVTVRPVDVLHSDWDCTLESDGEGRAPAVRLGLRLIKGLSENIAERLMQARADRPFADLHDLALRAEMDTHAMQRLARADALRGLAGHRREQLWAAAAPQQAAAGRQGGTLLREAPIHERQLSLLEAPEGEALTQDYQATGLTLRRHPLALLRPRLAQRGVRSTDDLKRLRHGRTTWACGLVTGRQQPGTAGGTIFVTLEDEFGPLNLIVWPAVRDRCRRALMGSQLMAARGTWQARDGVTHLVAERLVDLTPWLGRLAASGALQSRDFH